ncbi:MAG: hypothetical protein FJZ86_13725 [Chloroflexi bacterium]|nr:hypothetical protein [Chloroflexota bacterium]
MKRLQNDSDFESSDLGEVPKAEGVLGIERLTQQTLKQPLDLPPRLGHPPPQRLDSRHHARKTRPSTIDH